VKTAENLQHRVVGNSAVVLACNATAARGESILGNEACNLIAITIKIFCTFLLFTFRVLPVKKYKLSRVGVRNELKAGI
jgi:hypothetical protein